MLEKEKPKRLGLRVLLYTLGAVVFLMAAFVIWADTPARPMPEALAALQSDTQVTVHSGKWLTFTPTGANPLTGLIIYPGGRVDYRAYAPAARSIAAQGTLVVIVPMPLNLAVFDPNAAEAVIESHPEIIYWSVGGHSLGGSMAANFAHSHPDRLVGLVLWASYPAGSDDLSGSGLKVLSISGTLDGLSTPAKIEASRKLLPADATWVPIQGGDHAGFGWYGPQSGDNPASISRQDQQAQIVQATVDFLHSFSK
ncbi:MAG TPA: alpha/beta hydrolase [Anaerolineales bacterium]|nr:alpha/beta hydrolase [Anaerolineales bacterium]